MRTLVKLSIALLHGLRALFRSREEQAIIELASGSNSRSMPKNGLDRD